MSKSLTKENKYEVVAPLPKGWFSKESILRHTSGNNKHRASFEKLYKLLSDGWQFCPKQKMRKAKAKQEKPNKNTRTKKTRKNTRNKTGQKTKTIIK